MRQIEGHEVDGRGAIAISADTPDTRYRTNTSHRYEVVLPPREGKSSVCVELDFQRGPIKETGVNGITHEVLLAILIDRLKGFQSGAFACPENAMALAHLEAALEMLHSRTRTRKRMARGVEGTNEQ